MPLVNKPDPIEAIVLEHTMHLEVPGGGKLKRFEAGKWVLINNPAATGVDSQWFITIEEFHASGYRPIDEKDREHFEGRDS